jgi:peptidyl-prolyl cis-trans isomerase C
MAIRVNSVVVSEDEIHREMQYHPAASRDEAERMAARALVVRRLLLDAALAEGLLDPLLPAATPAQEEDAIRRLMERNVRVEEPSEDECRAHFESRPQRYHAPDLFEASHILFLAPAETSARAEAARLARETIAELRCDPERFEAIARERSGCSSGASGGSLGQLSRGDTVPEFEAVFDRLHPGEIFPAPVETRFGLHVVRLDERARGRCLPYESVRALVADELRERQWRRAVSEYISALAGEASIEGFDLQRDTAPAHPAERYVGA